MQRFYKWLFSATCAALVLGGCTGKQGDPGPTGAAGANGATGATGATGAAGTSGQNLTGSIVGYVSPVDENGSLLNKSGVVVSIDGSTPAVTATTNADGRFELTNVRNGTYNLTYTRSDLATYRRFGVGHVGGDQPTYLGTLSLSQMATTTVTGVTATASGTTVMLTVTLASPTPTATFRYALFGSASTPVTSSTGTLLTFVTSATNSAVSTYTSSITFSRTTFTNAGFAIGSTVYVAAYGSTASTASYSDPSTGRFVYPALNQAASPTVAFVVP